MASELPFPNASEFLPVRVAAVRLGLPIEWLLQEARQQRIPCLRIGTRIVCRVDDVARALAERARTQQPAPAGRRETADGQ